MEMDWYGNYTPDVNYAKLYVNIIMPLNILKYTLAQSNDKTYYFIAVRLLPLKVDYFCLNEGLYIIYKYLFNKLLTVFSTFLLQKSP